MNIKYDNFKPKEPYGYLTQNQAKEATDDVIPDVYVVLLPEKAREHKSRAYQWLYRKSWYYLPSEFQILAERVNGKWRQLSD